MAEYEKSTSPLANTAQDDLTASYSMHIKKSSSEHSSIKAKREEIEEARYSGWGAINNKVGCYRTERVNNNR